MKTTKDLVFLALFVALAVVLRGVENLIPNPVPWLRIGLANIVTLLVILRFGLRAALWLTALRVLIASLLFGTFLSPPFLISFTAGLGSTLVMGAAQQWWRQVFSPIGISVLGGFMHNLIQLCVAYLVIIRHGEVFYLFPALALLGIATGCMNGWIVIWLYDQIVARDGQNLHLSGKECDKKLA